MEGWTMSMEKQNNGKRNSDLAIVSQIHFQTRLKKVYTQSKDSKNVPKVKTCRVLWADHFRARNKNTHNKLMHWGRFKVILGVCGSLLMVGLSSTFNGPNNLKISHSHPCVNRVRQNKKLKSSILMLRFPTSSNFFQKSHRAQNNSFE